MTHAIRPTPHGSIRPLTASPSLNFSGLLDGGEYSVERSTGRLSRWAFEAWVDVGVQYGASAAGANDRESCQSDEDAKEDEHLD